MESGSRLAAKLHSNYLIRSLRGETAGSWTVNAPEASAGSVRGSQEIHTIHTFVTLSGHTLIFSLSDSQLMMLQC